MENGWERERLHLAAAKGDLAAVEELLRGGFSVNAFDDLGKTPLHYAVQGEHFDVVQYLLRHGADVNAHAEQMIGNTPLGDVAGTCSLEMARILVEAGADPTVQGWMQATALDQAKERRRKEGTGSEGQAVYEFLREAVSRRKPRRR